MQALVLDEKPRFTDAHDEPVRRPGEALVRMRAAGVCDTDLQLSRGYMGFRGVLGHEFVGEVLEADDARWIGRRVVADINAGCETCDECTTRGAHHCPKRTVLGILGRDGAFAERLALPERCLVAVPDHVDDEHAVFAEPLAAALHVLDVPGARAARRATVVGDGKLGQLVARALRAEGLSVTLVGHHPEKLRLAAAFGITGTLERDAGESARSPLVVDATGSAEGLSRAISLTEPRGTLVLKTTVAGGSTVDLSPLVIHEIRLVGSRCGDPNRAVEALADDRIDPTNLIEARYPLGDAERALEHAGRRGALKVLITSA